MSQTLLQLVQQAAGEMGMPVPALVVGSSDSQVKQYRYLINGLGQDLARMYPWQVLNKQHLFTVTFTSLTGSTTNGSTTLTLSSTSGLDATYQVSGDGINQATFISSVTDGTHVVLTQAATSSNTNSTYSLCKVRYSLPSDFDRVINNTHWDKSKHWQMLGPETAQQWEWLISGYIATGPRIRYRIFGNYFQIWPMLSTANSLGFEYVGNGWAASSGGTAQTSFQADTDTCIFHDRLMVTGLKLKFFQVKGFDTTAFQRDYSEQLNLAKNEDGQAPDLSMNPAAAQVLIGWNNIPDSGYGS